MKQIAKRNVRILTMASSFYIIGLILGGLFNDILPGFSMESTQNMTVLDFFKHNYLANLFLIFTMFTFGIFTSVLLLMNGFLVSLSSFHSIENGNDTLFILTALLPHGLFEIPAMVLSGALGFKLLDFVYMKVRGKHFSEKWFLIDALFFLVLISLLTILAAIVEALLTPFLLKKLLVGGPYVF
ncbi:stage II sporulation protein M [Bacillus sp. NPDC077027]|uniref:stage II sporulation protein M n=1 Tax=Bacillus sp. NPDC077027 TaxID=3390548 RepID=UPI003D03B22A